MLTAARVLAELERLRRENRRLLAENDALKKRAEQWEDGGRALQWGNLLDYDGRRQDNNLPGKEGG